MKKHSIAEGLRKLALLGTVFLAVPVWLTALLDPDPAAFALALVVCLAVWAGLQLVHDMKWRARLVESSLGVSQTQLATWGVQKSFVDQLLVDTSLRAQFHTLMERHTETLAAVVRRATGEHYEDYLAAALQELRDNRD